MNAKPWEPVIEGKEMDGGQKEEREWENVYQALVNTAEPRIDFLLYLGKVFVFFFLTVFPGMLCSFREPQGPLSGLGLMRQNTALSRDGKALSVFSIDARELSFGEKMGYF